MGTGSICVEKARPPTDSGRMTSTAPGSRPRWAASTSTSRSGRKRTISPVKFSGAAPPMKAPRRSQPVRRAQAARRRATSTPATSSPRRSEPTPITATRAAPASTSASAGKGGGVVRGGRRRGGGLGSRRGRRRLGGIGDPQGGAVEGGELVLGRRLERVLVAGVHALRAVDATVELEDRLEALLAHLLDGERAGRAILLAELAADTARGVEVELAAEGRWHLHLHRRVVHRVGLLRGVAQHLASHPAGPSHGGSTPFKTTVMTS